MTIQVPFLPSMLEVQLKHTLRLLHLKNILPLVFSGEAHSFLT